jgi:DNA polymerase-1
MEPGRTLSASPVGAPQQVKTWAGVRGGKYHLIDTLPKWRAFYPKLMAQRHVVNDLECTGLQWLTDEIVGFVFCWGIVESYYIPVNHKKLVPDPTLVPWNPKKPKWIEERSDEKQLNLEDIYDDLTAFYLDPNIIKILHNAKFDLHFLRAAGFTIKGIIHDTRVMHSLIDENSPAGLKEISKRLIHPNAGMWEKKIDEWRAKYAREHKLKKKDVHYGLIPLELMVPYASSDGHYTLVVYKDHLPQIAQNPALRQLYVQVESKLLFVLLDMEHDGVVINSDYLSQAGPQMEKEMAELKEKILKELGDPKTNIGSNAQVIPLLQKKGVKFSKKTKTGKGYSLDAEVLEKLAIKYPICNDLLKWRRLDKKKGTYVESILEKASKDQKLHCEYNQNVSTGRMSAKKPNTMNIPRGDTAIRQAFVAPIQIVCIHCGFTDDLCLAPMKCPKCGSIAVEVDRDFFLCFIDFSQIEVRLTAHYSQDPILLDVYNNTGEDVHLRTCCEMFGYRYKEASLILQDENHAKYKEIKKKRQIAKMINFLIIYGGGAKNLALRISTHEEPYTELQCKRFISTYFDKYRGIAKWIAKTKLQCRQDMEIQNYFGRYRRLPELRDANKRSAIQGEKWKIERALRQGVNYLIQGSAADLFKIALVRVHDLLKDKKTRIVMPIHDEIVFYFHKTEMALLPQIKAEMEDFNFRVPIVADIAYSRDNWANKKELKLAA